MSVVATEGPETAQTVDLWPASLHVPPSPSPKWLPSVNTLLPPAPEVTVGPSHPSEDRSQVLPLPGRQVGPQLLWEELAALSLTQIPRFLTPGARVSSSHTFGGL